MHLCHLYVRPVRATDIAYHLLDQHFDLAQ